jgi:ribose/xylose/arabinose/galactoside ABC-type transport system permease subunit
MAMTSTSIPSRRTHPLVFVLAGGLVAGTLDIVFACIFWALKRDVPPERILQSVAAGLLGDASFEGGAATAALGLALHFLIATSMAVVYYLAALRWPPLWQQPVPFGAAYGLLLYVIMNYVVVPLSAAGRGSKDPLWIALSIAVHVFLIGIPIAVFARRAVRTQQRPS